MNEKGQVTIFVVLGVVIVITFSLIYVIIYDIIRLSEQRGLGVEQDSTSASTFIEGCLSTVSSDAALYLSLHGGQYSLEGWESVTYQSQTIPLFTHGVDQRVFEVGRMQEQYAMYVANGLPDCFENFEMFEKSNVFIDMAAYTVEVVLGLDNAFVTLQAETFVRNSEATKAYDGFSTSTFGVVLTPMLDAGNAVLDIARSQAFNQAVLCETCLQEASSQHGVQIVAFDETDYWLVTISHDESEFVFAVDKT